MRTINPKDEATIPSQQINVRTNVRFLKFLMAEKKRMRCSLGDAILRLAALGAMMDEDAGICPKAPPGPRPKVGSRNGHA